MFEVLLLLFGLLAGVDLRVLGLLAVAVFVPMVGAAALVVHCFRSRSASDTRSAVFCQTVAREMRAGANLRQAMLAGSLAVSTDQVTRELVAGTPIEETLQLLRVVFPEVGPELATVVQSVSRSGGASAPMFDELGDLALAQVEIAEEIRVATAPARASAMVLMGLPTFYLGYQFANGQIGQLFERPAQQGLTVVGVSLVLVGVGVSWALIRRAS